MKYLAFIGYDLPEALEVKIEAIMPLLDKYCKRIDFEGDQVHIIEGEVHINFINDILEAYNNLYDFNLTFNLEGYEENTNYERLKDLSHKANFVPLTAEEETEWNIILDEEELETCEDCNGAGDGDCLKCEGTGFQNLPEELKEAFQG